MNAVLVISAHDNVATALEPLEAGRTIGAGARAITVAEAIPRGHKIAIRAIAAGEAVVKYGSPIGTASADIACGAHVHTHNVASSRGRGDLEPSAKASADPSTSSGSALSGAERAERVDRIAEPADGDPVDTDPARVS